MLIGLVIFFRSLRFAAINQQAALYFSAAAGRIGPEGEMFIAWLVAINIPLLWSENQSNCYACTLNSPLHKAVAG
jgi:hypothetical protein